MFQTFLGPYNSSPRHDYTFLGLVWTNFRSVYLTYGTFGTNSGYCTVLPFYLGVSTREWAHWLPFGEYDCQERQNDFTGFPCDETTLVQFTVLHKQIFLLRVLALGYKKACYFYLKLSNYSRERVNRAGWTTTLPKRVERTVRLPQFVLSRERQHLLHAKWQSHYYESQQSLTLFSSRNEQEHILHGILVDAFWKYTSAIAVLTNRSFEGLI